MVHHYFSCCFLCIFFHGDNFLLPFFPNNGFIGIAPKNKPSVQQMFILWGSFGLNRLLYVIAGMNVLDFGVVLITHLKDSMLNLALRLRLID